MAPRYCARDLGAVPVGGWAQADMVPVGGWECRGREASYLMRKGEEPEDTVPVDGGNVESLMISRING